jgi:hypothetical protein
MYPSRFLERDDAMLRAAAHGEKDRAASWFLAVRA